MLETMQWLAAQGIEIVTTDLPPGIAAQYYVRQKQVVVANDLDVLARLAVLRKVRAEVAARGAGTQTERAIG